MLRNLTERWRAKDALWRNVATLAGGSAVAQVVTLLATPVLTRLYEPSEFGVAAGFAAVLTALGVLATLRFEIALALPPEERSARCLLWFCLGLAVASAGLLFLLLWCVMETSLRRFLPASLHPFWWLLPPAVFALAAYQAFSYWAIRRREYRLIARTKLWQAVSGSAVGVGIGAGWAGPLGLLLSSIVYQSAGGLCLARGARGTGTLRDVGREFRAGFAVTKSYLALALQTTGAALLNQSSVILPPMLLIYFYGEEATGGFSLAQRTMLLPMALIGTAVSQVFLGEASALARDPQGSLGPLYRRVTRQMLPLAALLLVGGAVCPLVFPVVFGSSWRAAGWFAALLAVPAALQLVVSPVSTLPLLRQRQSLQLGLDALRVLAVVGGLWLPFRLGGGALAAVGGYSAGMVLVYVATFFACTALAGSRP